MWSSAGGKRKANVFIQSSAAKRHKTTPNSKPPSSRVSNPITKPTTAHEKRTSQKQPQNPVECRPILTPKAPKYPSLLAASLELSPNNPLNDPNRILGPTFFRFTDLPAELRLKIWDMCIPCRRPIGWHETTDERCKYQLRSQRQPPVVAHVCYESRAEALKYAQRLTIASLNYTFDEQAAYLRAVRRAGPGPAPAAPSPEHFFRHPWTDLPCSAVFIFQPPTALPAATAKSDMKWQDQLTHPASFVGGDNTITATTGIWFDTRRDELELPPGDFAEKGVITLRGAGALTRQDVMGCWSHEKVAAIEIDGVMEPLASRVQTRGWDWLLKYKFEQGEMRLRE